jgi:hypothetical protein
VSWIAVVIFFVVVLPLLGFLAWTLWQESSVRVQQRQLGLVIVRGKPTDRALPAGKHFVSPFSQEVEVYPDHELTYMAVPNGQVERMERRDVDFADPPLGLTDGDGTPAGLCYTIRFRLARVQLRQVHERFGPAGIGGIVRDEGRKAISTYFVEDGHRLVDLLGAARGPIEVELGERVRARLEANGFELTLFSLQEPDLRGLGELLQQQALAREAVTLEQIRAEGIARWGRKLADALPASVLEYRALEVWRSALERWDGATPLVAPPWPPLAPPAVTRQDERGGGAAGMEGGDAAAGPG